MIDPMDVEGMLSADECALLTRYAAAAAGAVVEIGAWRGRSTVALANGAAGQVVSIDRHDDHLTTSPLYPDGFQYRAADADAYRAALERAGIAGRVEYIRGDASAVQPRPCGLLFVDADPNEAAVAAVLAAWLPSVAAGGYLALHDVGEPGVAQAMDDLRASGVWRLLDVVDLLAVWQRVAADPAPTPAAKKGKK